MKKSLTIQIEDRAKVEIADAYDWYEEQKTGLGEKFFKAFEKTMDYIKKTPEGYEEIRYHRQIPIKKFPFVILYERVDQVIYIDAVFHTSRNPEDKPE